MTTAPNSVSPRPPARTQTLRRRFAIFLLAAIFAGSSGNLFSALAQQGKPGEYQVEAVYLYNFAKFIDWPPGSDKDGTFTICVLGRDPFGPVLDATLVGETIGNRKPVLRRVVTTHEAECEILFISSSESGHVKQILASIDKPGVLTVSDLPEFTNSGGVIQFVLKENKIRFEVNLTAAEKAGLTVSSQLLKVATAVKKSPAGENAGQ